jgi:hypothetical protein
MTGDTTDAGDAEIVKGERSKAPRVGRRDVMLGTAAAGAGVVAGLVAGADPAGAATGTPMLLGKANSATAATSVSTTAGAGLKGQTGANGASGVQGVDSSSAGGSGVRGDSTHGDGVYGETSAAKKSGVAGLDNSSGGGYGVWGYSTNGTGVYGTTSAQTGVGVHGVDSSSAGGFGVFGNSTHGDGVHGETSAFKKSGVAGLDNSTDGGYGVYGATTDGYAVYGAASNLGTGVWGTAVSGPGVYGATVDAAGVYGVGVYGNGVQAHSKYGTALYVEGDAQVTGNLSKGGGSFKIDHPLDPGGKYLYHSFVESPDMMNVYNGIVVLDGSGSARVELPEWFEALNRDFRYALTALDRPAPDLHVSARVANGAFSIAGGNAGQEVSWQVTGIRQDAWANAHRIPVEVDKPAEDRGRYLHPELFGGEPISELAKARVHRDRVAQTR